MKTSLSVRSIGSFLLVLLVGLATAVAERTFVLNSVRATGDAVISVLSQNDRVLEYKPEVDPRTTWKQTRDGLLIKATRAQRIYNDRTWPNPVVLKITHAAGKK